MLIYHFYLPDISCSECVKPLQKKLKKCKELAIEHSIDITKHEITIQIKNSRLSLIKIRQIIDGLFTDAGIAYEEIRRKKKKSLKEYLSSHWFLGAIGSLTGLGLLALPFIFTAGLPLFITIIIAAASTLVTLALGAPFYWQGLKHFFKTRTLTMDLLFTISTVTVIGVSIAAFFFPWLSMMFEAGLLIFGFRHIGIAIEESIKNKLIGGKSFKQRLPKEVEVVEGEELKKRPLKNITLNDILWIKPGEIIPIDGICLDEDGEVYDTIVTGSVLPRFVRTGEKLFSGMYLKPSSKPIRFQPTPLILSLRPGEKIPVDGICNSKNCIIYDPILKKRQRIKQGSPLLPGMMLSKKSASTKVEVSTPARYSYLHRLDENIKNGQFKKAPIEEATAKILGYFIPTVIALAIFSGIILSCFFPPILVIQCVVSILVSACPCTLGLIIPIAIILGMKKAADKGIQFKNPRFLQHTREMDVLVFDLNGTLTTGVPKVANFAHTADLSRHDFFSYLWALEQQSLHPFASAIRSFISKRGKIYKKKLTPIDNTNHSGVKASFGKERLILGNKKIMQENGIDLSAYKNIPVKACDTLIYLARNAKIIGYVLINDPLRKDAKPCIDALKKMNKEIYICTGADKDTAKRYANVLNIAPKNVRAGCIGMAEEGQEGNYSKVQLIKELKRAGKKVALVGDGANDALASSYSDLPIAIKSKHGDAITQQNAALVVPNLWAVVNAFKISSTMVSNIKQNLVFSLGYNMGVLALILVSTILVALAVSTFTLNPAIGVALMGLQAILIFANAYRFKKDPLPPFKAAAKPALLHSHNRLNLSLNRHILKPEKNLELEEELDKRSKKTQIVPEPLPCYSDPDVSSIGDSLGFANG